MKKVLCIILSAGLVLTSCEEKSSQVITDKNDDTIVVDNNDFDNTTIEDDSTDAIIGTYQGVLPCASCEGIETNITFNNDGSYSKQEVYLDEDNNTFSESGTYEWDNTNQIITTKNTDKEFNEHMYKVVEDKIIALDADGNMVEDELADAYVLSKK